MIEIEPENRVCTACHTATQVIWFHHNGHNLGCTCSEAVKIACLCRGCLDNFVMKTQYAGPLAPIAVQEWAYWQN